MSKVATCLVFNWTVRYFGYLSDIKMMCGASAAVNTATKHELYAIAAEILLY